MKTRLFLPLVLLCVAICLSGCQLIHLGGLLPEPTEPPSVGPCIGPLPLPGYLTFLSFSESSSYFKRVQGYDFRAEDGANTAYFWIAHEEEPYAVRVDEAWVDQLTDIVQAYNMILWDGFSGSDSMLLDGTHFSVTLEFSDGTTVNANGYGRFPEHYGAASEAIDAHFLQLLPEDMRDW